MRADVVTARNFPRPRLSGSRLSWPKLAKARFGLVLTLHRWQEKLVVFFTSYNSPRLLDVAQESRLSLVRRCFVVTPVDMLAVEVTNVQTGVWERRYGRWCESRAWKFVDQGCNETIWRPGQKANSARPLVEPALPWPKFGAPVVESEFFRRQIYCIEESTCDIVGTFRRLQQ